MDRDYAIFIQSINEIKDKLEKENNDSYKKILKALKDFIDAADSMHDLNPKEAEEFKRIVQACLTSSLIAKFKMFMKSS